MFKRSDTTAADRQRRYRLRQGGDLFCVQVEMPYAILSAMVARGYLKDGESTDHTARARAVAECLVDHLLDGQCPNSRWQFYVYHLLDGAGTVAYVGKGSGDRLAHQKRRFGLSGHEVARFKDEIDALAFESAQIEDLKPHLNKNMGSAGRRKIFRAA